MGKEENAGNHSVLYSIKERNHHLSNAQFVVCKYIWVTFEMLSFGKGLEYLL